MATPEPYYPNMLEKILHIIGIHQWDKSPHPRKCVICDNFENKWILLKKTTGGSITNGNGFTHKTLSISFFNKVGNGFDGTTSL